MVQRFYRLPSLTALAVFEAAARHRSFKHAASELNVTPGAVSHQVKSLEEELGSALFVRLHREVALTDAGEELYATLARGFSQTAAVVQRIRESAAERSVTIGATTAMATFWLAPKLGAFWREHPEVVVNQFVSDNRHDLQRSEIDLRLRYGGGVWRHETAALLFRDRLFPVCGPEFAQAHPDVEPANLPGLPLIRLQGVDPDWVDWGDWLHWQQVAGPIRSARHCNNYAIALQAARDNRGVALGWGRLVAPLLSAGALVRLTAAQVEAPGGFYLTWNAETELSAEAVALRDWLIAAAAEEASPLEDHALR